MSQSSYQLTTYPPSSSSASNTLQIPTKSTQAPSHASMDQPKGRNDRDQNDAIDPESLSSARKGFLRHLLWWRKPQTDYTFDYAVEPQIIPATTYSPGYGRVAASMNLDRGFLVFRRFGWLNTFVLLHLQYDLQDIEERLAANYQQENGADSDQTRKSCRTDAASTNPRSDLITEAHEKLKQYGEMLLRTQGMLAMKRPLDRYQSSVNGIVFNGPDILDSEANWIRRSDDLVSLVPEAETTWFNGFVEDAVAKVSRPFLRKFLRSAEDVQKTGTIKELDLTSPKRIDVLSGIIITLIASFELLVPLLVLYKLQQTSDPVEMERMVYFQILTIFISTVLFSASISIFTTAQWKDVFIATATYCAVQVVVLSNTNSAVAAAAGGVKQSSG